MGYQTIKESKAGIYAVAAALRLVLVILFPSLPDLLTGRVEISTPVNSFKRLQEGLFLYKHNVSPYDGGVYHQAPLFLPLLSLLPDPSTYPLWTSLLYIVVDLLSADALYSIAESGEAASSRNYTSARKDSRWNGRVVAAMFLFNPFTVATCLARPTSVFSSCAILYAISQAISGRHLTSVMSLSFAAYLSMYPIFLLPPLLYLAYDRSRRWERKGQIHPPSTLVYDVLTVCGTMTILFLASYLVTGSWEFLASTYGVQISLTDLTPNGGLWWYYFVEMFDSFRAFFLGVFVLHLFSYTPALTIRLRSQPLAVLTLLLGIHAIFKPYPSIAETTLFLALLPCFRHVLPLLRYSFLAAAAILYSSCLGPAFYHLWIYAGSGNANFFYAITLVWSLGQSLLVSDLTHAILRDEFEVDRPEMRGKEIRQI